MLLLLVPFARFVRATQSHSAGRNTRRLVRKLIRRLLILQNHLRDRPIPAVRDRQMEVPSSHPLGKLRRFSRQMNSRLPARRIPHFNVPPTHPVPPSRAQRFHGRFFRRKARRVPLKFRLVPLAIPPLLIREHALDERPPKSRNRCFHAVNLGDVHAHPDNHFASRIAPGSLVRAL